MRKIIIKVQAFFFIVSICLMVTSVSAYAVSTTETDELIVTDKQCELSISYTHAGQIFDNETVKIWRIASVSEDYQYTQLEPFSSLGLKINGIKTQTEWKEITDTLSAFVQTEEEIPSQDALTDENGMVHFQNLDTGLYLVSEVRADNGEYICVFEPFLVALPTLGENLSWLYQVESYPKAEEYKPKYEDIEYKVVKLWKDSGYESKRPVNIEIEIYHDNSLAETVLLNAENNWTYTWSAKDDGSVWTVIEKKIPEEYTMTVQKNGWIFTVINTSENTPIPPKTGDSSNILLWVRIAVIAGAVLVIAGFWGKNHSRKREK